jgi:hypothetical protein
MLIMLLALCFQALMAHPAESKVPLSPPGQVLTIEDYPCEFYEH